MRKILLVLILFPSFAFAQLTTTQISAQSDTEIRQKLYSPGRADAMFQVFALWKKGFFPDGVATGTDTYAVTVGGVSVYLTNAIFTVQFPTANTVTNPSLNVNALGIKTIVNNAGAALAVGDIKAGGTYDLLYDGVNFRMMNIAGGGGGSLSDLTAATATAAIDNLNFSQDWQWNTLEGNSGLKLNSNSTAAANNLSTLLELNRSGANANINQTVYGLRSVISNTGTGSNNIAGYFSASGAVDNVAIMTSGLTDLRGLGTGTNKVFRIAGSTDIERFKVLDNGETVISNGGGSLSLRNDGVNSLIGNAGLMLSQGGASGLMSLINNGTSSSAAKSFVFTGKNFNPASGSVDHTFLELNGNVNQTGTAIGVIRGIHIKPVLTSVTGKYVGLEIDAGSNFALVTNGKTEFNGNVTMPNGSVALLNDNMTFTVGAAGSNYFQVRQASTARVWMAATTTMGWNDDVGFSRIGNNHLALGNATTNSFSGRLSASEIVLGSNTITASAILDLQSTAKAFIPPRMTTAQKNAITAPTAGMVVYDTDLGSLQVYSTSWKASATVTDAPDNNNLGGGNIIETSSSNKKRSEKYWSSSVTGGWSGNFTSTNILNTVPNNSLIEVTVTFTGIQTSGTVGSTAFSYKVIRSFRRTTTTTTAVGAASVLYSTNDTGDTFGTVPTLTTSGSNINLDRALTTSKTFDTSLLIEVVVHEF